jgi:hypothetical protein
MFGGTTPLGRARGEAVHTAVVDSELLQRCWAVYSNDPTIWACRRIMLGLMANAEMTFQLDGQPLEVSDDFQRAHREVYFEVLGDVLDCIRVQGFVPYLIEPAASEGRPRSPVVPPHGTFTFETLVDPLHRVSVAMQSMYVSDLSGVETGVFVLSPPDLHGAPSSVLVPLLPELEEYRAMKSAAVEDQLKKARATLVTQERRYGGGAPTTDASATALADLNMFLGEGTGDLVSRRVEEADNSRLTQLSEQVRRARSINAQTLGRGQAPSAGDALDTNLLALPKDQELCSSSTPPAPLDVVRYRKHLEYQITSAMGVPALLLMPGNSTYKVDDMVLRSTNTELRRLCQAASAFFTRVFRQTYRNPRKRGRGRPPASEALRREAQSVQARIDQVTLRVDPPPFLTMEAVQAFTASGLFKTDYTATLLAKALDVYREGVTEEQLVAAPRPARAAAPQTVAAAPPPVVAQRATTAAGETTSDGRKLT